MKLVLDASAFLAGVRPESGSECYTIQEILDEIKVGSAKLILDLSIEEGSLRIVEPSEEAVASVKKFATESGDIGHLSASDIKLIALALDLSKSDQRTMILTDDYAVQNLSKRMGVLYSPIAESGIKRYLKWKNICKGCGKRFPIDYEGNCDRCGSVVVRKAKPGR